MQSKFLYPVIKKHVVKNLLELAFRIGVLEKLLGVEETEKEEENGEKEMHQFSYPEMKIYMAKNFPEIGFRVNLLKKNSRFG